MYLNPRNLSVREEVSNVGRQSSLRKELQLSGWDFYRSFQQALSSQFSVLRGEPLRLLDT
jgi:hypothetical protein